MQLYSLTMFRAIAIVLVVLSHATATGSVFMDTPPELFVWNLVTGPTTLFVFISGFLFHHAFLKRFEFASFFAKKLRNLVVPYIVLTFVALAVGCTDFEFPPASNWFEHLVLGGYFLATGDAAISYWYIPFVIVLFAMSPVHAHFATLSMRKQMVVMGVLFLAALFVHRPPDCIGVVQNLIYFTPTYLLGMFCSQHRAQVYPWVTRWQMALLAAVLLLTLQLTLDGQLGNSLKPMFQYGGIDLMLIQKVCLALFLLAFLRRFEGWRSRPVDMLADTSFAVFFLHPIPIQLFVDSPLAAPLLGQESWLVYLAATIVCIAACAAAALWSRRLFGPQSRLLTGY